MRDIECPYCGAGVDINHDDGAGYAESEIHQQECPACEKTFIFTTTVSFHYSPEKADCLNGVEHSYEKTKTYPVQYVRLRCTVCGDEKPATLAPA